MKRSWLIDFGRMSEMSEVRVTDPVTGGQKGSKPERFDLFPWDALEEIARVYGFGAGKYADHNWLRGYPWSWSFAALGRHIARWACGEDRDPESGCLHLAHAAWHCLTLITFTLRKLGTDNRAKIVDPKAHQFYEVGTAAEPIELVPVEPAVFDLDDERFDEEGVQWLEDVRTSGAI